MKYRRYTVDFRYKKLIYCNDQRRNQQGAGFIPFGDKNMKRLTLEELKEKANATSNVAVLEKIKGGDWSDCHGCPSFWSKAKSYLKDAFNGWQPGYETVNH